MAAETKLQATEQALRESEARYRTLFTSIDQGYCVIKVLFDDAGKPFDYVFEEVNPAFEEQTGIKDPTGRSMLDIEPRHDAHWFEIYGRIALTGVAERFENVASALHRWFDVYAFRIGEPHEHRVAVLFSDITHRKQSEHALLEADRRKDEFLAMLAHELRNPLAPIRNSLHVLRMIGNDGPTAGRVHEMLVRQVDHMVRLVDDLMEVSRITGGKVELRKEAVELATVLGNAVETSRPLIDAARHELTISMPAEPLMLMADPVRLAQVVANLLNNAAKYTDDGGRIWLTVRRDGSSAVISVRDNGVGIPGAMLPRVFDLFTQVERNYNQAKGGLGIGLTLVHSLVDMHGGSVEATSEGPGKGSEFLVRLPLMSEQVDVTDQGRHAQRPGAIAPRRILVVDDNRDAADSLGMVLRFLGADVHVAYDGPAALSALGTYRPDVALLDIGMPGMDGYEVARQARQTADGRDMTLIALTGWGHVEDRRRSRAAGIDHHLVKPVDIAALEQLLTAVPARRSTAG